MKVLQYAKSLVVTSIFCVLILFSFVLITIDGLDEIKWAMWFLGTIILFYVFIGSLFWELLFRIKHFKTWWRGGIVYFLLGTVYGGLALTVVTFTIGETEATGWIIGMGMMGIAAFIFYMIRKRPL